MSKYRIHCFYAATGEYCNNDIAQVEANSKEQALSKYLEQFKDRPEIYKWYTYTAADILQARLEGTNLSGYRTEKTYHLDKLDLQTIL